MVRARIHTQTQCVAHIHSMNEMKSYDVVIITRHLISAISLAVYPKCLPHAYTFYDRSLAAHIYRVIHTLEMKTANM